jgi:hypothetical protein
MNKCNGSNEFSRGFFDRPVDLDKATYRDDGREQPRPKQQVQPEVVGQLLGDTVRLVATERGERKLERARLSMAVRKVVVAQLFVASIPSIIGVVASIPWTSLVSVAWMFSVIAGHLYLRWEHGLDD